MMGKSQETTIMDIYHWCHEASRYIRFKPDREQVYQELLTHLFDKVDDFESSGMKHEEALEAAIEAMGDATEIGLMMRKIHKPYLGYQLSIPKVLHWRFKSEEDGEVYDTFKFILKAKHSPFLDAPIGILERLTAIDSLGNYYTDITGYRMMDQPSVVGNLRVERLLSSQFEMWIYELSPDAEWIELQYDFLGRSFRLRMPTIGREGLDL